MSFPEKYLESVRWKQFEIDIIKNNYKNLSDKEIHKVFYRTEPPHP